MIAENTMVKHVLRDPHRTHRAESDLIRIEMVRECREGRELRGGRTPTIAVPTSTDDPYAPANKVDAAIVGASVYPVTALLVEVE
ncbi:hypothetical protein [Streptomyces sp. NPDC086519]|uniref:hypothetical protein n=1 Tax=unclassified Streptomyces TaxID=2593676 RepID=UPI0034457FE1